MSKAGFPELQILSAPDLAETQAFSRARADKADPFVEWSAPWRQESLEHYLKLGWSVARRDSQSGRLLGYLLAQPVLFFRRQTQTVWVEYIDAETHLIGGELFEAMLKIAREKHMQRVLIQFTPHNDQNTDHGLGEMIRRYGGVALEEDMIEFKTTKG